LADFSVDACETRENIVQFVFLLGNFTVQQFSYAKFNGFTNSNENVPHRYATISSVVFLYFMPYTFLLNRVEYFLEIFTMCFSKYFSIPKMVEFHRKISYMQLICGFLTKCPKRNFSVFDVIYFCSVMIYI
jgi:hypothetical protein